MGESDAVEKAACSKARVGVGAICKLSGQKSRACKSAQRTYAAKCGASVTNSAAKQVSKIKKQGAKSLGRKLRRVNKQADKQIKVLKAQVRAVTGQRAKRKL